MRQLTTNVVTASIIVTLAMIGVSARGDTGEPRLGAAKYAAEQDQPSDSESLVTIIAERNGIELEAARNLIERQSFFIDIARDAEVAYPASFAGSWITSKASGGRLTIGFAGAFPSNVADFSSVTKYVQYVDFEHAPTSRLEYHRIMDRLHAQREMVEALGTHGMAPSYQARELVLYASEGSDIEQIEQQARELSDSTAQISVKLEPRPQEASLPPYSETCQDGRVSCNPLRAGLQVVRTDGAFCTAGWFATMSDTNSRMLLTAGHCGNEDDYFENSNYRIGQIRQSANSGRVDAARINVRDEWSTRARYYRDRDHQFAGVDAVYRGSNLPGNADVCKSGAATGFSCGEIRNGDGRCTGLTDVMVITRDMRQDFGDSGSPAFHNAEAYGTMYAGVGNELKCASYVTHIESRLGVIVQQ